MFNLSGSEIVFLLLLALIVLGPEKLPEAVRKFGKVYGEVKKMGSGFQSELKSALDEPMREMRETADAFKKAAKFEFDDSYYEQMPEPEPDPDAAPAPDDAVADAPAPAEADAEAAPADEATPTESAEPVEPAEPADVPADAIVDAETVRSETTAAEEPTSE